MTNNNFHKRKTIPPHLPDPNAEDKAEIPAQIGPYPIQTLLEKGSMSILYLGTHPKTKDPITIKVLSQKYMSHPDITMRFLNEAEIIAMADHPNIVKLYGHGEWEGGLYIAMEFIEGISLRQYMLQHPLSLKHALEIILDIAYALCHLHTHGVIHRDLKPENILITGANQIKVIDFGIAQLLRNKKESEEGYKNRLMGTPIYMSPEQRENPENVSYPSDIYSLGIISYELVLGRLCHGQVHLSLMPKGLQKILSKALQTNPTDRYQDVVDFITDIAGYLHSSTLQKEKKAADQISEIYDKLQHAQQRLLPAEPPDWKDVDVAIHNQWGLGLSRIYYDFFHTHQGQQVMIIGESSAHGPEAVVATAMLRGMVRSIMSHMPTPEALVTHLNSILLDDPTSPTFTLAYVLLDNPHNRATVITCGYANLWAIPAGSQEAFLLTKDQMALGIDVHARFPVIQTDWMPGDSLILIPLSLQYPHTTKAPEDRKEWIKKFLSENPHQPMLKQLEGLLRRTLPHDLKALEERSVTLAGFTRRR